MSNHVIHVMVSIDDGWMQGTQDSMLERVRAYIESEVMDEFGRYGRSTQESTSQIPFLTEVRAIP